MEIFYILVTLVILAFVFLFKLSSAPRNSNSKAGIAWYSFLSLDRLVHIIIHNSYFVGRRAGLGKGVYTILTMCVALIAAIRSLIYIANIFSDQPIMPYQLEVYATILLLSISIAYITDSMRRGARHNILLFMGKIAIPVTVIIAFTYLPLFVSLLSLPYLIIPSERA